MEENSHENTKTLKNFKNTKEYGHKNTKTRK
jgi:hypothetical protein